MSIDIRPPYTMQIATTPEQVTTLQAFIGDAYLREFRARIPHFLPLLIGLYRADDTLVAACGLQLAATGPLYLEQYLDLPAEQQLAAMQDEPPRRDGIAEIGNLATSAPGNGRLMFAAMCQLLYQQNMEWVMFTGTRKLRNSLRRLQLDPITLAVASPARVGEHAGHWGDYYQHQPMVMAGRLAEGRNILSANSLLLPLLAPTPSLHGAADARAWQ